MVSRFLVPASLLLLAACASGRRIPTPEPDRNAITAEEVAASPAATVRDLIRQLRPTWLRSHGPGSMRNTAPELPVVYIDRVRTNDPNILDRLSPQIVREIRFLNGRDATTAYGFDHGGGAILIFTGR